MNKAVHAGNPIINNVYTTHTRFKILALSSRYGMEKLVVLYNYFVYSYLYISLISLYVYR